MTLIIGDGPEGERVIRHLHGQKNGNTDLVGIVSHLPEHKGNIIHGVPVIGHFGDLADIISGLSVTEVIIAYPSDHAENIRKAVRIARDAGVSDIRVLPPFADIIGKTAIMDPFKEIEIEDLLGRKPAKIETDDLFEFISGHSILITGAAGSIGSEIARQTVKFTPSRLFILDNNESGIFDLAEELRVISPNIDIIPVIADITDNGKINKIFSQYRPEIVFHAAAYKHVPLMEEYPEEAVKVNVIGTYILGRAAINNGVKTFVLISTDKAVKPEAVMGKTKRAAEIVLSALDEEQKTRFVSVRFGNVLGSRGSVIPTFKEKIRRRRPIAVTHPDMRRYFMTIPEAALLVMEAGVLGKGGEIFVLDMGEPIRIVDLAEEMIRLSGLEPHKDIPIVFSGIRPGEKLFEELLSEDEIFAGRTEYEKIIVGRSEPVYSINEIKSKLAKLASSLDADRPAIRASLDSFIKGEI